jgi:hypothetical protein
MSYNPDKTGLLTITPLRFTSSSAVIRPDRVLLPGAHEKTPSKWERRAYIQGALTGVLSTINVLRVANAIVGGP